LEVKPSQLSHFSSWKIGLVKQSKRFKKKSCLQ